MTSGFEKIAVGRILELKSTYPLIGIPLVFSQALSSTFLCAKYGKFYISSILLISGFFGCVSLSLIEIGGTALKTGFWDNLYQKEQNK